MKKLYLIMFILPVVLFSKSYLISNVPLPKTQIQNLDPYPCNEACLKEYLYNGMIFSFLSHADSKLEDTELESVRLSALSLFNIKKAHVSSGGVFRVAMILPYKVIGKYSKFTTDSVLAYLLSKNNPFELKTYKIENESRSEIQKALDKISEEGIEYVIAPFTHNGLNAISDINPQLNVYFPTINIKDVSQVSPYFIFGAIDYRAQSDLLLQKSVSPLVLLSDKSVIGKRLSEYQAQKFEEIKDDGRVVKFSLSKKLTNLQWQFKNNRKILRGSFFINTPIVKTSMIMSQITLYDRDATNILSTQINYKPLLLSMTQYEDRKRMIVANSIVQKSDEIIENSSILGVDIVYNWINYTTSVGVDYFYSMLRDEQREYTMPLDENQVQYPIELLKPARHSFYKEQEY
jgi:hypothetical protein